MKYAFSNMLESLKEISSKILSAEYLKDTANRLVVFFRLTWFSYFLYNDWLKHHEDMWESMPCVCVWIVVIPFLLILFFADTNARDVAYFIAFFKITLLDLQRLYYYFLLYFCSIKYYFTKIIDVFLPYGKSFFLFWRPLFKKSGYLFKYLKNKKF